MVKIRILYVVPKFFEAPKVNNLPQYNPRYYFIYLGYNHRDLVENVVDEYLMIEIVKMSSVRTHF